MSNPVYEIEILNNVYGGNAIGRMPDGRTIFIPFALPGEKVEVEVIEEKKDFYRGRVTRVLRASPKRITPRCAHFSTCGGCHYQHLAYADQLELKQNILLDQLKRVGRIDTPPVRVIVPSTEEWNYRNTVQFHVAESGRLGFHAPSSNEVVEITECHLPLAEINELWPCLDFEAGSGLDRAVVRSGVEGEMLLGLESEIDMPPEFSLDFPLSVIYLGKSEDLLLSGDPYSRMSVKGVEFIVSARSFFQVNLPQAEAMVEHVLGNITLHAEMTVMDLYCGVGLFSRFIAPQVKDLIGVELSESACNDFAENLAPFENVSLYVGTVEQVLAGLEVKPDLVLLDPPRAGLGREVVDSLLKMAPQKILYVSCDPTTLARDLKKLIEGGYQLESVTPFDLFPQTYHIESISVLTKILSP